MPIARRPGPGQHTRAVRLQHHLLRMARDAGTQLHGVSTNTHAHAHARTLTHTHTHTHVHIDTCTHAGTHTHARTHSSTHALTRAHTHTHSHTTCAGRRGATAPGSQRAHLPLPEPARDGRRNQHPPQQQPTCSTSVRISSSRCVE